MSDYDGLNEEQESFGRPFLGRVIRSEADHGFAPEPVDETPGGHNRPYLITGGRTGGGAAGIGIETLLIRDPGAVPNNAWSPEMAMIVRTCDRALAVAEVAAYIGLPIGVVQVLAGDLVAAGVLQRSATSKSLADDVAFIERLIHGVSAL
ncbi:MULTISPECIES: DUF742 domain-containing protein [Kineosporia]|uniref:DUF742 domain-containing protein n=1 Tax=Kineosporia mesophila TaxID=566012 RepID=A0ABP6ZB53_9ACTN|nr:DUF742 domain-containing protein [Kineosporia sp. NBRC 101731]MCD5353364.1 DUF742 domain-containing protein [Kineosporia mesophila]GLY27479.1 hypothetical protein Kisp02_08440 [Kineosporia sp. NBRC 101731]